MFDFMNERNKTNRREWGCPRWNSTDIEVAGDNHHQTKYEMEYLEYCKCNNCNHNFVE